MVIDMRDVTISDNEAGQRMDKFLGKYLKEAGKGFIYKMLRKKNILLNGRKSDGSEKLCSGDVVRFYLADETVEKFRGREVKTEVYDVPDAMLDIIYEDSNIILINKPAGMLTQKAKPEDVSLNEYLISYLVKNGSISENELQTFKPSVCNRLDRNTSGIVLAGKSLQGLQILSDMLRERTMDKFYFCLVKGRMNGRKELKGYLIKDNASNKVKILKEKTGDASYIHTIYEPVETRGDITLLKVKLVTGKPHQIRAHLSSDGHPIIGDGKYGDEKINRQFRQRYKLKHQLLHAGMVKMPQMEGALSNVSGKTFEAPIPEMFMNIWNQVGNGNME